MKIYLSFRQKGNKQQAKSGWLRAVKSYLSKVKTVVCISDIFEWGDFSFFEDLDEDTVNMLPVYSPYI